MEIVACSWSVILVLILVGTVVFSLVEMALAVKESIVVMLFFLALFLQSFPLSAALYSMYNRMNQSADKEESSFYASAVNITILFLVITLLMSWLFCALEINCQLLGKSSGVVFIFIEIALCVICLLA